MDLEFKKVNCYEIKFSGVAYIFNEVDCWDCFVKLNNDELGFMYCANAGIDVFDGVFGVGGLTVITASDKIVNLIKGKE